MSKRKEVVVSRAQLVNLVTKLENTKNQASVNAFRRAFKQLVLLDADATLNGYKSPIIMLRNEALAKVKAVRKLVNSKKNLNRKKK